MAARWRCTEALKQALDAGGYDVISGGARRDPATGAIESGASSLEQILFETLVSTSSERSGRVSDEGSLERHKR